MLQTLKVKGVGESHRENLFSDEVMKEMRIHCPNLKSLEIVDVNFDCGIMIYDFPTSLVSLKIVNCGIRSKMFSFLKPDNLRNLCINQSIISRSDCFCLALWPIVIDFKLNNYIGYVSYRSTNRHCRAMIQRSKNMFRKYGIQQNYNGTFSYLKYMTGVKQFFI